MASVLCKGCVPDPPPITGDLTDMLRWAIFVSDQSERAIAILAGSLSSHLGRGLSDKQVEAVGQIIGNLLEGHKNGDLRCQGGPGSSTARIQRALAERVSSDGHDVLDSGDNSTDQKED